MGDADAFGAAVTSLIADPDRRRKLGLAAAKKVQADHDFDGAADILDRRLRALVE
jgi:hypothetical protein